LVQVYQDTILQIRNLPTNNYAGFDERDVKDYNMSDYDTDLFLERQSKMKCLKEDKESAESMLRVYLMLVFQIFSEPLSSLEPNEKEGKYSNTNTSANMTNSTTPPSSSRNNTSGDEIVNAQNSLLEFVDSLLRVSKQLEEESLYALCIQAIAAIDQQLSVAPQILLSPSASPRSPTGGSASASESIAIGGSSSSSSSSSSATQCVTTPVAARLAFVSTRTHFDLPTV